MAFEIIELIRGVVSVKITGQLNNSDLHEMRAAILEGIRQQSRIRLHVIIENFTGCEVGPDGDDLRILGEQSRNIERVAILGEEQTRDAISDLIGKVFQSTFIEHYSPSERAQAIAWLTDGL
jgi:hypothetical protein